MSTRLVSIGISILMIMTQLLLVAPAYACSAGPDFDPVAESDVIVGGRITAWERLPTQAGSPFTPILLTMTVDQPIKGDVGSTVQCIDPTSLSASGNGATWVGSSGACGVFDSEPSGQYLVLGLTNVPDGSYRSNLILMFFRGPEPAGDAYTQAMERLRTRTQRLTPTIELTAPSATPLPSTPLPAINQQSQATPQQTTTPAPPPPEHTSARQTIREAQAIMFAPLVLVLGIGVAAGGLIVLALRRRRLP